MRTALAADDPDGIDAQMRAAARRLDPFATTPDEPDPTPAAPNAATPAPLPSGGHAPDYSAPDGDKWLRDEVRRLKYGITPRTW